MCWNHHSAKRLSLRWWNVFYCKCLRLCMLCICSNHMNYYLIAIILLVEKLSFHTHIHRRRTERKQKQCKEWRDRHSHGEVVLSFRMMNWQMHNSEQITLDLFLFSWWFTHFHYHFVSWNNARISMYFCTIVSRLKLSSRAFCIRWMLTGASWVSSFVSVNENEIQSYC